MQVTEALDQKDTVDSIIIDFSKAFDVVPHEILLLKMKQMNIDRRVVDWLKNFLQGR